jgi:hypothetical protein
MYWYLNPGEIAGEVVQQTEGVRSADHSSRLATYTESSVRFPQFVKQYGNTNVTLRDRECPIFLFIVNSDPAYRRRAIGDCSLQGRTL